MYVLKTSADRAYWHCPPDPRETSHWRNPPIPLEIHYRLGYNIAPGISNGHVTGDVAWPAGKANVVAHLAYIWMQISRKPLEIEVRCQWTTIVNSVPPVWRIEWSRDRWRRMILKGQDRDQNIFRAHNPEKAGYTDCYTTQQNTYRKCHLG